MEIFLIFPLTYILLYFSGYFLKVFLLSDTQKQYDLYITPWFGLGVIIIGFHLLGLLGVSVGASAYFFLAFILVLNVIAFIIKRETIICNKSEVLVLSSIGLAVCLFYYLVIMLNGFNSNTQITMNWDFMSYVNAAQFALEYASAAPYMEGVPSFDVNRLVFVTQYRGGVYLFSYYASLFRRDVIEVTFLLTTFISFLNISVFRIFLGRKKMLIVWLLLGTLGLNTLFQWLVYGGAVGQLFSIGFIVLLTYLFMQLIDENKFNIKQCVLIVFTLTAISLSYLESIAYPIIPVVVFSLIVLLGKKCDKTAYFKNMFLISGLFAALNFSTIFKFFRLFITLDGTALGWDSLPIGTLFEMSGLYALGYNALGNFGILLFWFINALLLYVIVRQIISEGISSFLSVFLLSLTGIYIIFIIMYADGAVYNVFKASISFAFIFLIFIMRYVEKAFLSDNKIIKSVVTLCLALFIGLNLFASAIFSLQTANVSGINQFNHMHGVITQNHKDLSLVANDETHQNSNFILNHAKQWDQMVAEYYSPTGQTFSTMRLMNNMISAPKHSFNTGDIYIEATLFPEIFKMNAELLLQNEIYSVYLMTDDTIYFSDHSGISDLISRVTIPGDVSRLSTARRINNDTISLTFISNQNTLNTFTAGFYHYVPDEVIIITAYFNDFLIGEFPLENDYTEIRLDDIDVKAGANIVTFKINHSPEILRLTNMRFSNYTRENFEIQESPNSLMQSVANFYNNRMEYREGRYIVEPHNMISDVTATLSEDKTRVFITVTNNSSVNWRQTERYPLRVGVSLLSREGELIRDFDRVHIFSNINSGRSINLTYTIPYGMLPSGKYILNFQMMQEYIAHFPIEVSPSNASQVLIEVP